MMCYDYEKDQKFGKYRQENVNNEVIDLTTTTNTTVVASEEEWRWYYSV